MDSPTKARLIAVVGTLLVAAYAALAALQILVLNPLAAVPGKSLPEIEATMAQANEGLGTPWVLAWLGVGVAMAVGMFASVLRTHDARPGAVAAAFLVLLALGAPAYFLVSFGPGMALADAFGISGADHSPWALPLFAASGLAVVALVALSLARPGRVAGRRAEPT